MTTQQIPKSKAKTAERRREAAQDSLAAAKAAQQRDRELVYQATGIRVTDDGRIVLEPTHD